jgi:hypothetical protein
LLKEVCLIGLWGNTGGNRYRLCELLLKLLARFWLLTPDS